MAFRIASILGAGCLSQQFAQVLGEEKEYFPLSGGIDDGVEVEVKFDAVADASTSKIEFVDRERKAAFRLIIDKASKTVTRESSAEFSNSVSETFGGWASGLDAASPPTLKFTKRRHEIAVSIGGTRFPWYDYSNRKRGEATPLLTHMAVFSGLSNPEVTLRRPTCTTQCNVNECLDAAGKSVCEGGECYSVMMSAAPGVATSCSASKETSPGSNSHCCDGDDAPPPARTSLVKDQYATLATSAAYLQRVCSAFGDCNNDDASKSADQFAGAKVVVDSEPSADGRFTVFIPQALDARTTRGDDHAKPASTKFKLPKFAVYETFKAQRKMVEIESEDRILSEWEVDNYYDIIAQSNGFVADAGVEKGWYVHLAGYTFRGKRRVAKLTARAAVFFGLGQVNRTLWMADQSIAADLSTCTDLPMVDVHDKTCADYSSAVCTIHGYSTPEGCTQWGAGEKCDLPQGKDEQADLQLDQAPALLCCACGGGSYTPPADWEAAQTQELIFK